VNWLERVKTNKSVKGSERGEWGERVLKEVTKKRVDSKERESV
jgi:hypothetical protein